MNEATQLPTTSDLMTEQDKGRCAPAPGSESAVDMSLVPEDGLYTHPTIRLWDGGHEIWISRKTPTHISFTSRQGERTFGRFKWTIAEFMAGRENYIPNH
jgi:hypothetical protein